MSFKERRDSHKEQHGRSDFLTTQDNVDSLSRRSGVKSKVNQIVSVKGAVKEVRERKYCVDLT